jgi:Flp pilus assembly protein TadG
MVAIARVNLPPRRPLTCRKPFGHGNETGAELIEFAFVLPLLLLVIVGIFDFGFLFQRYEVVTNAAREGARAAVLPD